MSGSLTVGLLAHVDAGKTTLSEAMLYQSGTLRRLGRVDHRDAFLDTDVQERERGITIFSKQAELSWQGRAITLVDTPGHVDFSGETERALRVLDCAVLVISAADGVQGHTATLWRLLQSYHVPTFLFINKMDQPGANRRALMEELKNRLSDGCVDMLSPDRMEQIATCSEEALAYYLQDEVVPDTLIAQLTAQRLLFPCFFGSALRLEGIDALLNALCSLLPAPQWPQDFSARIYKISRDPQGARLTWMKITGGSLRVRTLLSGLSPDAPGGAWEEKISQLRIYSGAKFRTVEQAEAGMLCAVTGLNYTRAGDGLGAEQSSGAPLLTPVFTYRVLLPAGVDPHRALDILRQLEEENPQLHVLWNEGLREIHVQLMGEVQLEILSRVLRDRFGLAASFGEGGILYRETIAAPIRGAGHYEPLRHYAEVHLLLEPGERGSGLHFAADCPDEVLERGYQRLILTHLMEKRHPGVLTGAPITDMKITLVAGRAHPKHTEGGDFRQATYRAVRQGLMSAQSVLLEPWYDLRLELPQDCVGRAMNDIQQMGGSFTPPETLSDCVLLLGSAPVAAARHYAREVTAYTRGRGRLTCTLRGYAPCRDQEAVVAASGYDPERDLGNPADSIFCAHGAGFTVKWNEVNCYMHLHPEQADRPDAAQAAPSASSRSGYRGTAAEDEELQAIFERTYGPAKPRAMRQPPRTSQPTVNNRPIPTQQDGPEYLLVDGYNIIFAWEELKAVSRESLEHARQCLMDILANYHGFHPCELIVVFDAYKVAGNVGATEEYHGIHIVYTREAETADNYIEKTIYKIAKDHRVRVATSDALEQMIILGSGALRVSAAELHTQVQAAKVEIDAILRRNNSRPDGASSVGAAMRRAMEKGDQA